ncbi:heme o synthase [Salibacterium sp. K-3]
MDKSSTAPREADIGKGRSEMAEAGHHPSWRDYLTVVRPLLVCFYLIPVSAGMFLASVYADFQLLQNLHILLLTLSGAALSAAGGFALNNCLDRDIDAVMERTSYRPSAAGRVKPVRLLTAGLFAAAAGIMILGAVEPVSAFAAAAALIMYVLIYTLWLKRFSALHTVAGSIAGAVPPLIGWSAVDPGLHAYAWLIFCIMFIWYPPHFLALAMQRRSEYREAGVPVLPVAAGDTVAKRQMVLYVAVLSAVSLFLHDFGAVYTAAAASLGTGWLVLGAAGFFMNNNAAWARYMFVYSFQYMTILLTVMAAVHIWGSAGNA